jgi:acetyltransferase-like isoleucine patch superfamily enzyme
MSIRRRLAATRTARWLRHCESVGEEPQLIGKPDIYAAPGRIVLGHRFRLASRPVAAHLAAGPDGMLEIGDDVSIAHGAAISAYERVQIGDGSSIGPYVVIMDTNFHGDSGDQSIQHDCRPVIIGRDCVIGSRVTITRGATIGDGAEILAGSVVSSDIPSGACAGGARARVIGRARDAASRWDSAAALLPRLVRDVLVLDNIPDLTRSVRLLGSWDSRQRQRLTSAVEECLGVALDAEWLRDDIRLADVADLIERRRAAGSRPQGPCL